MKKIKAKLILLSWKKYEIIEFIAISALGSFKIWSPGEKECYVLMHLYLLFKK